MGNTCCNFLRFFLLPCFSQVATNFTLTSETSVILLVLRLLPSNATKKLIVKNEEDKLPEVFFDGIRRGVQPGLFFLLGFPVSHQLPRLTSPFFSGFPIDC